MPTVSFDDVLGLDDEFDPLMADDLEIDQEDMDDDNPLDTVDYPTMRNMPQPCTPPSAKVAWNLPCWSCWITTPVAGPCC